MIHDSIFLTEEYLVINTGSQVTVFKGQSSSLKYTVLDDVAYCPYKSSFSLFSGSATLLDVASFLSENKQLKKVVFVLPPSFILDTCKQKDLLLKSGFRVKRVELGQYLNLKSEKKNYLTPRFRSLYNKLELLSARTELLSINELPDCYALLRENRQKKGYALTISQEKLAVLMNAFPESFLLYGTFVNQELIACSVTIKASSKILYQFAWGHKETYDKLSPVIFHNANIRKKHENNHFLFLDLGLSSLESEINRGVFRFKKHQGAEVYKKYILEYKF